MERDKALLAVLPLSQTLSGLSLPQPLEQTFPLESTLGGGMCLPQDTEAGEGLHCEPCLAKSHGEALGYSDGVAAQGKRVHFPHPREAGQPVLDSLGAHSGGGNWRAKLLHKSLQGDSPQPRKALEARDRNSAESGPRPEPWLEAGPVQPPRLLSGLPLTWKHQDCPMGSPPGIPGDR